MRGGCTNRTLDTGAYPAFNQFLNYLDTTLKLVGLGTVKAILHIGQRLQLEALIGLCFSISSPIVVTL